MDAQANVLAGLVQRTVDTKQPSQLSDDEKRRFHEEFEREVAPSVEKMRIEKRKSYESVQDIAVW